MAKNKGKWLAEATTRELIVLMKACLKEGDTKKGNKIIAELLERIPEEDGNLTIEGAVKAAMSSLETILDIYNQEVSVITEAEPEDEEDEEEEKPKKKAKKSKKKVKPEPEEVEEDEEDEDEDDEDEDGEDDEDDEDDEEGYDEMTQGELKKELRRRGIKVTKSMKKADMIRALEADDEE